MSTPNKGCACPRQDDEQSVAVTPQATLVAEAHERFKEQRIGQQTGKAPGIACAIEEVGIGSLRVFRVSKPSLHNGRV